MRKGLASLMSRPDLYLDTQKKDTLNEADWVIMAHFLLLLLLDKEWKVVFNKTSFIWFSQKEHGCSMAGGYDSQV